MTPEETSRTEVLALGEDPKLRRKYMVTDEPVRANIRVGLLLEDLDKLAEETALKYVREYHPEARVVTAAMDDLEVHNSPDIEYDIVLKARINFVGRTSLEVGVRLEQTVDGRVVYLGSCYFTMVARSIGEGGERSLQLPGLEFVTEDDQRRAATAQERRSSRRRETRQTYPTQEEYDLLYKLHMEAEAGARPGATPHQEPLVFARDLVTEGWERTYPEHENVPQKIFGGYVVHRAYMYAHLCAEMVADKRAILVSTNRIDFYQPVRMGDKLHFVSRVTYTGRTSVTVETSITRISRDRSTTSLSNTCLFTFINVDHDLHLMPVPQIYPMTYQEDAKYLAGLRRAQEWKARSHRLSSAAAAAD